jgi:hypothetical protein
LNPLTGVVFLLLSLKRDKGDKEDKKDKGEKAAFFFI